MLWEPTFYEKGSAIAKRIAALVPQVRPDRVTKIAREARNEMQLRHVPLFLIRELARLPQTGMFVASALTDIVQRADELAEFLAMYWKDGRQPLAAGVKRGLRAAFQKFNGYQLAKYNRDGTVKLRDVLRLVHPRPLAGENREALGQLATSTLEPPDTWEVALSRGEDKCETFERLLRERKLGGMATLRNLRNMLEAGVSKGLIIERLASGCGRALPFRFVTAAKYAPSLEPSIEEAMLKAIEDMPTLPGMTGLLVDVSGSMEEALSKRGDTTRMDAASGLAIYLAEVAADFTVATFSRHTADVPSRRGFALRDAITNSQQHGSTYLRTALEELQHHRGWGDLDRVIIITDEQSHDGIAPAWARLSYVINVAPYQHGLGYGDGWTHINGWSERVIDFIRTYEGLVDEDDSDDDYELSPADQMAIVDEDCGD
jgi:hypothetical protein